MGLVVMGVVGMGVVVTGCPKKNPYDSHTHNHLRKLITALIAMEATADSSSALEIDVVAGAVAGGWVT